MISERLKTAMQAAGLSQAELARRCGVKPPSVNGWLSGKAKFLRGENLLAAAQALGISQHWLATGKGEMKPAAPLQGKPVLPIDEESENDDIYRVRKVQIKLQAGICGFEISQENEDDSPIYFRKDWMQARGFKHENLIAITIRGDSMEPGLYEGDVVVINTADKTPVDGEVFAINYEGEAIVKRLIRDSGKWWLSSDNHDQRKHPRKECAGDYCLIIGRIVHKQSEKI